MATESPALSIELNQQLRAFKEDFLPKLPPETAARIGRGLEQLVRSGIDQKSLKIGDVAPDFTLPNATGAEVNLYRTLAQGPAIIAFYRGAW